MHSEDSATSLSTSSRLNGWRGVVLVAVTYVYFLIFAQFGFLKRLGELGITGNHLKLVMGAMALGGILASLLAPRIFTGNEPARRLQLALLGCGSAALLTLATLTIISSVAASFLIGTSLGLLTVTLVANLCVWIGSKHSLLNVGLGTGLGYLTCNVPTLFAATPARIAIAAAVACLVGIAVANGRESSSPVEEEVKNQREVPTFGLILAWFTALIWLDSAAFFIIQNSPALKSGTWEGAAHLWSNGALHLVSALGSAWLIKRRGLSTTLVLAFASLGGACLLLLNPTYAGAASVFYPIGVSLYSVALVAYPSFLMPTSSSLQRGRRSGWIYAIAGWIGSAMGIGMGQNLHHIPPDFVLAAAILFLAPWFWRIRKSALLREAVVVIGVLGAAFALQHLLPGTEKPGGNPAALTLIQRGRQVYISEGCINCHSQYVRPNSPDVLMWGPAQDVEAIRREKPPLIGNRRQGPDLSEVGSRRSPLWLRMHFINPRDVSYDSIMPSYAYLFHDSRGDALIAYMSSLKSPQSAEHLGQAIATWKPSGIAQSSSTNQEGKRLFGNYCATCHMPDGKARINWTSSFKRLPPNLFTDRLLYVPQDDNFDQRKKRIAQIIKFGLPGTDMPGHEYLADTQVESIAAWVAGMRKIRSH